MQKCAHLVDLENFLPNAYFHANFVLIQPRTSPPKICTKMLPKRFEKLLISLVADARVEAPGRRREHRRLLAAALRELGLLRRGAGDEPGVDFGRLLLLLGRVRRSTFRTREWESS